ncbi:LysR family transcriptional regulator [Vibrio coralliilyticus]|uniref:Transcriptional regulator n=1 Tax=Vibrio coralliilyticus TaxID=190893 RepID=A0AAN0VZM0_9VIBR|nr:LysR family transcriptional regulator [Vibrio coralliilyticus]AIW21667.1 transcriptional regulator [Vibrio coralliilyticus]NOH39036.1 LysR family transcriptional regulator [Vibrio coralliilyticus]
MSLNHINLNLLRSLQVLLEECHVSRAADRLNITQSAVSRQLAQLRDLCGDPLLVREGNALVPTPRALAMQEKLNLLLGEFEQLLHDKPFDPQTWKQEFVLSSSDYVAQYIVPDVVAVMVEQSPNVNLAYRLWQPEYLQQFGETGIHLASTMQPEKPDNVTSVKIGEDKSVCLMRKSHPLSVKQTLTEEELVGYPHLKVTGGGDKDSSTDIVLKSLGFERRIALKVPFFSAAVNALVSSDYLMVVPEHIALNLSANHNLEYRPLPFETEAHQYWLMWHPKYDQDKAHQWMREMVLHAMRTSSYSVGMT